MRKWLIVAGGLVLAAAVAVTLWAVTRSDDPRTFKSPIDAATAICGPDTVDIDPGFGGHRPNTDYVGTDGVQRVIFPRPDGSAVGVVVERTSDGMFTVEDCNLSLHG